MHNHEHGHDHPHPPHPERHFTASDTVRDVVIGMADGLTVPFALAAGLSGAVASNHIILAAGFAEIAAGSIAMGLGGYLAARGDAEHYANELKREYDEIVRFPEAERQEIRDIFETYGVTATESAGVLSSLERRGDDWVNFMMRFELGLEEPQAGRAWKSALTIALAYIVGGLVPLAAYIFVDSTREALNVSIGVTLCALALFGGIKGHFTGVPKFRAALQTTIIGGIAAACAFGIARWVS